MTSIRQHIARLEAIRNDLPLFAGGVALRQATMAASLVTERSIEKGINRDGAPGAKVAYSKKVVPSYLLKGKELNQAGRNHLTLNPVTNWYELRKAQGLRSENVNLTYEGRMWKQYGVIRVEVRSKGYRAVVGISGDRADVFDYNVKRYGEFYRNTPAELIRLRADAVAEKLTFIRRYLN